MNPLLLKKLFMTKIIVIAFLLFTAFSTNAQQNVIRLYNGAAPGSENWTYNEQEYQPGTKDALV